MRGHEGGVDCVAFNPGGTRIVSASSDKTVRVWDARKGDELLVLSGHKAPIQSVAVSPDGRWIATASWDKTVRIWDARTGKNLHVLEGHESPLNSVAFTPDGKQIMSASVGTLRLWDAETGDCREVLQGRGDVLTRADPVDALPFRVLSNESETVVKWGGGQEVVARFPEALSNIAVAPNGRTCAGSVWPRSHLEILTLEGGGENFG